MSRLNNVILTNALTRDTGNLKGYGYVTFSSVEEAKTALRIMKASDENEQSLHVEYANPHLAYEADGGDDSGCEDGRCRREIESEEEMDREEKSVRGSVY